MGRRNNSFDGLRLLLASAVIVGHSPELIDGNRSREPLTRLFGTASLGEVAVCGFFILSGYLITASWKRSPDLWAYVRNRALRIVPAFVVAFAVSVFIVGPLAAKAGYFATLSPRLWLELALLLPPTVPAAFPTLPYPNLNGSIWTIHWEAICYLLTPLAALVFRSRLLFATGWLTTLGLVLFAPSDPGFRFVLMFLSGAALFLTPPGLRLWPVAVAGLLLGLLSHRLAFPALALFGGYLLVGLGALPSRWKFPDISYGVFLYGWPVQQLLILQGVDTPWLLAVLALVIAACLGLASWFVVERYASRFKGQHLGPERVARID